MMKRIFIIDWMLLLSFLLCLASGIGLHAAGHGESHEVWHDWAVFHVLASLAMLILGKLHVQTHWAWYKGWFRNGLGKRSRVTVILSFLFLLTVLTGLALILVEGESSRIGLWHYKIALMMSVISIGHILKRLPLLKKRKSTRTKTPKHLGQNA